MLVIKNDTKVIKSGGVFALGNFDGVHLGHKEIIDITKDISIKNSSYAGVIVFEPHPRTVSYTHLTLPTKRIV